MYCVIFKKGIFDINFIINYYVKRHGDMAGCCCTSLCNKMMMDDDDDDVHLTSQDRTDVLWNEIFNVVFTN